MDEELGELKQALGEGAGPDAIAEELGDLIFACVNVARRLDIDPEQALRGCNDKFVRRFNAVEDGLAKSGRAPEDATLEEMDGLWNAAKRAER